MKRRTFAGLVVVGLLLSGAGLALGADSGPVQGRRGCGFGYGGPPRSAEERAARQAACLEQNGGVCPNGGPRAVGPGMGRGRGNGMGQGWRHGLRDGTGPRWCGGAGAAASVSGQK